MGPIGKNSSKQAKAKDGFAKENFIIDFDRREVTCPNGKVSGNWIKIPAMAPYTVVRFGKRQCGPARRRLSLAENIARPYDEILDAIRSHDEGADQPQGE